MINQLYDRNNANAEKLSPAQVELYVRELRSLQTVYKNYEGTSGSRDKVSLNRSQGLGKVETSMDDLLTRPVTDIFNSGLTLEVLKFRGDLSGGGSSTGTKGKTAAEKAQAKYDEYYEESKIVNTSFTTDEEHKEEARKAVKRSLEGAGKKKDDNDYAGPP